MMTSFLSNELIQAIAWTIVHSLWQITLIACVLALVLRFIPKLSANNKYYLSVCALGLSVITSIITFTSYYGEIYTSQAVIESSIRYQAQLAVQENASWWNLDLSLINNYVLAIVNAWILGSILFFLRFTGGYLYLKKVVKNSSRENSKLIDVFKRLNKRYGIHRKIDIRESINITTPMVVGYLKPIILFPIGLVNQLSTSEIEAILAHELAHIKRHDFLVNLFQIVTEIAFYFHPAIWYISSRIRYERENCCDDMAINHTKSSIGYAKTLVKLQELQVQNIQPALAFSGEGNSFSNRIKRILGAPPVYKYSKDKLFLFLFLLIGVCAFAKGNADNQDSNESPFDIYIIDDCPVSPDEIKFYLDTIPERNSFKMKKKSKDKDIEMEMEDGEITKLVIEGQLIPATEYNNYQTVIEDLKPKEDSEIITLFPNCHNELGRIYYLDKFSKSAINLDSIIIELKEKTGHSDKHDFGFLDYDFDKGFEEILVDSVRQKLFSLDNFGLEFNHKNNDQFDTLIHKFQKKLNFKSFDKALELAE